MTYKLNIRRITLGLLPIIALVFGGALAATSQTSAPRNVKNIVLIHGGFVDGSGWEGVYNTLKKKGYNITIVQNPTLSLADDVAVTKRVIAAHMRFTSRSRAPLLLSLSKQRMVPSQRRSRIASPRDEARCTERRVYDHATRLEEGGSLN